MEPPANVLVLGDGVIVRVNPVEVLFVMIEEEDSILASPAQYGVGIGSDQVTATTALPPLVTAP